MKNGRKGHLLKYMSQNYELYLFLLPALIYIIIFAYLPIGGVQIAFRKFSGVTGIWGGRWVGLKYFRDFFSSYYFWPVITNTLTISLYSLVVGFPIPILFALLLNEIKSLRFRRIVQTVSYAPHFISTVVMVSMLNTFFAQSTGLVNFAREALGFPARDFMGDPSVFSHMYVWSGIWQETGWGSIIYIAALSAIDTEQYEAARIDGANTLQRIWYIDLPSISGTMIIMLILRCGSILSVGYEKVYLMQNDLNLTTSEVISTYVYRRGLIKADFSFSTAVGLFNNVINFILLTGVNYAAGKLGDPSLF